MLMQTHKTGLTALAIVAMVMIVIPAVALTEAKPTSVVVATTCGGTVGTVCADGKVYAGLSPDGNEPMYAMPCDLGMTGTYNNCTGTRTTYMWGTYSMKAKWKKHGTMTGLTSAVMGRVNTVALIANYGTYNDGHTIGVPAAQACVAQTYGGHSNWYLPAKDELHLFWIGTPAAIGGLDVSGSGYWSSTEFSSYVSWIEQFSDGYQTTNGKTKSNVVRCVRR